MSSGQRKPVSCTLGLARNNTAPTGNRPREHIESRFYRIWSAGPVKVMDACKSEGLSRLYCGASVLCDQYSRG